MLRIEDAGLILLAAGRSARFDAAGSKLDAELRGRPLGLHAATTLGALPFAGRWAVTGRSALPFERLGFETVGNPDPSRGLASSLALGVAQAQAAGVSGAVVALADMPFVGAALIRRLFAASGGAETIVAAAHAGRSSPPALFGRAHFAALGTLTGDTGARALLGEAIRVAADGAELADIDTVDDLSAWAAAPAP